MTTFPTLTPSTRTYSPGAFPHTAHRVYNGTEARVRHSNTVLGARLRLFFPALTTAELIDVIAHYNGQQGRFLPFAIPDELLSGTTTPADFTPADHQWRYAAKPTAEDISVDGGTNLHNLTVELETVPPENTIVQGARLRARAGLQAGSPQLGIFLDATVSLAAGAAEGVLGFIVTTTLAAGPGLGDPPTGDARFADVDILLPLDGTNGSTTIPDASDNAISVTVNGGAQISTAQSKFGGSSLYLQRSASSSISWTGTAFGTDDFTVEFWLRVSNFSARQTVFQYGSSGNRFNFWIDTSGNLWLFSSQSPFGLSEGNLQTLSTNTWYHIAVSLDGNTVRPFIGGVAKTTSGWNNSFSATNFSVGGTIAGAEYVEGYVDDLRITAGTTARYVAAFTPPTEAHPTF